MENALRRDAGGGSWRKEKGLEMQRGKVPGGISVHEAIDLYKRRKDMKELGMQNEKITCFSLQNTLQV